MKAKIIQGDDAVLNFTIKDKTETVVNLTGVTALDFKLKRGINRDMILEKTLGDGVAVTSAVAGTVAVTLDSEDTGDIEAGKYYFELEITDASGNVSTVRDFDDRLGVIEILGDLDND